MCHYRFQSRGTVVSTLPVDGVAGLIVDVDVTLDITHDFNQDLDVYLTSPSGTRVELFSDVGGSLDNFTATILDDEANTSITAGTEPFTGHFRPEGMLADFDAEEPNGTWVLEVTQDTMRLMSVERAINGWSLSLTVGDPTTVTDQNGTYAFTDVTPRSYTVREDHQPTWTQTFPATTSGGTLYGLAPFLGTSQLVAIDTNTGAAVPVGPTGRQTLVGLTASPDGTVYSIAALGDGLSRNLYSVDTATGSLTTLFSLGTGVTFDEGGLAWNPSTGEILAMDTVGTQGNPQLYRINPSAQDAAVLGNIGLIEEPLPRGVDVDGLTFAGDTLYGLITGDLGTLGGALNDHLITINNQLRVVDVGPLGVDIGITAGLAYDPGQDVFYASGEGNDNLYRVDRTTGTATLIGPTGVNQLSGLVFVPGAAPATNEHTVALGSGASANNVDFGNAQLGGAIHGIKWNDQDGDGVHDPSEPGINGITIEIVDPDTGHVVASQVTHSRDLNEDGLIDPATEKGVYWFNSVVPGTYHVREILPENTRRTFPGGRGRLFAVEVVQRDIADGELVSGSIGTPGEQDAYNFSLSDDSRLYFDALVGDSNVRWTLAGPSGTVVTDRSFRRSDSFDQSNPVLNLFAGDYTLTVDGITDHTAAYAFRLLHLDDAEALTPGTPVSLVMDPANATQLYEFTASGNERFYFDLQAGSVDALWRLVDAYDNTKFSLAANQDHETSTLPSGKYTLMIEGRWLLTGTRSYDFNVQAVPTPPTIALTVGTAVHGDILVAGEKDEYAFTLTQAQRLHFDSLTDANTITWTLEGPGETLVASRPFGQSNAFGSTQPILDLAAGDYRLVVDGNFDNTGSYGFRLLDADAGTTITPGVPVSDALLTTNMTNIYGFDAAAGDQFYFDVVSGFANATWRLVDPHNRVLFSSAFTTDHDTLEVDTTGHYVLLIEGWRSQPSVVNYQFHVQPVTPSPPAALAFGSTVSAEIAVAGELDVYHFAAPTPLRLHFDALAGTTSHRWSLTGPTGTVVNARSIANSDAFGFVDPVTEIVAGDYTLTVDGTGDHTGPYSFRLLDLATATPMTLGNEVSGTLNPGNESAFYRFDAAAGDQMEFDLIAGTINATWRLVDPYGNILFSSTFSTSQGPITLTQSGSYILAIEGQITEAAPATFSFNAKRVGQNPPPPPSGTPLTVGSTINGSISLAGEEDNFVLTLPDDAQLYFDSFTSNSNLRWELVGPPGTIVSSRSFAGSDAIDNNLPVLDLVAGQHVFTVRGAEQQHRSVLIPIAGFGIGRGITFGNTSHSDVESGQLNPSLPIHGTSGRTILFRFASG